MRADVVAKDQAISQQEVQIKLLNRELGEARAKAAELEEELNVAAERADRFEREYHSGAVENKALSEMLSKEKEESRELRAQVAQLEAVKRDLDDRLAR